MVRLGRMLVVFVLTGVAAAQGTKLWTVGRYEEMERGSTEGVAIRNDGRLEAAPGSALVYTTGGTMSGPWLEMRRGMRMWGRGGRLRARRP